MEEWDDSYAFYHYHRPQKTGYGWITGGFLFDLFITLAVLTIIAYFIYNYVWDNYARYADFKGSFPANEGAMSSGRVRPPVPVPERQLQVRQPESTVDALEELRLLRAEVKEREDNILRALNQKGQFYQTNSFFGAGNGSPTRHDVTRSLFSQMLNSQNGPQSNVFTEPPKHLVFAGGSGAGFQQPSAPPSFPPTAAHSVNTFGAIANQPHQVAFPFAQPVAAAPTLAPPAASSAFPAHSAFPATLPVATSLFGNGQGNSLFAAAPAPPFSSNMLSSTPAPFGNAFSVPQQGFPVGGASLFDHQQESTRATTNLFRNDGQGEPTLFASPGVGKTHELFAPSNPTRRSGAAGRTDSPVQGMQGGFERPNTNLMAEQPNVVQRSGGLSMQIDMGTTSSARKISRPTLSSQRFAPRGNSTAVRGATQRISEAQGGFHNDEMGGGSHAQYGQY